MRKGPSSIERLVIPLHSAASRLLSDEAWDQIGRSLKLSPRELQIVVGIFDNLTETALATRLHISPHTVHAHTNRLFKKLEITTRVQMVLCVMEELFILTRQPGSVLPPICGSHAVGACPFLALKR